jgi:excisionase family DNA binding protein
MGDVGVQGQLLTLQQAADRLKVHYMTVYRWVRKGELPAFKTGGRLRVRATDVERFLLEREVDVALPAARPGRTEWGTHVDRLHQLLVAGQAVEAGSLVRKVVADGAPVGDVYIHLIAPALHRIGDDWAEGRVSVAIEHRATEIASAMLARLSAFFRRRGPSRGVAVTLTPPGDQHGLASVMVADFLRAGGYDVHHLGANVPVEDLGLFLQVVPTDVVCVSVTRREIDHAVYARIAAVVGDTTLVVGGQGADPEAAEAAGAMYVTNLEELTVCLDALA